MQPIELKQILLDMYGKPYGAGRKLANDIGVHEVTVSHWVNGHMPIGEVETRFIRLIHFLHTEGLEWRWKVLGASTTKNPINHLESQVWHP